MRRRRPGLALLLLVLLLDPRASAAASQRVADWNDEALRLIEAGVVDGSWTASEAVVLSVQRVFDPEGLPPSIRASATRPLRCATAVLRAARRAEPSLSPTERARIRAWIDSESLPKKATYLSANQHFVLDFETEGTHAVPTEDVDPPNGIPDFVERAAEYLETSWTRQIDELGFVAPDLGGAPYEIGFQTMGSYGYTTVSATSPGGTRIVLHSSFEGFPPNDDPEGPARGAAKVTAAHEWKHAIQFATTEWQEDGAWPELDATWAEDIVFDQVNDYYNYLTSGSPISSPASPLDADGGGSYPDCVFQHWISESWGASAVVDFWEHRQSDPSEPVLAGYEWLLQSEGSSFDLGWVEFAAWNYATGARWLTGFGYDEAADYPTSAVAASYDALPAARAGSVDHLAAEFIEVSGFTQETGFVELRIERGDPSTIDLAVIVQLRGGTWTYRELDLPTPDETVTLAEPLESIERLALIVVNSAISGGTLPYTVTVTEDVQLPLPVAQLDVATVSYAVAAGSAGSRTLNLRNTGAPGSALEFGVVPMQGLPDNLVVAKSIAGVQLELATTSYAPGDTVALSFSVTNPSPDFEWLQEIEVDFPTGVTVDSSSTMTGGSAGDLVSNGSIGDGAMVLWTDANGSWGNIKGGESASASVHVRFDLSLFGDLAIGWTIRGDGYGGDPHTVSGTLTLSGPTSPLMDLLSPDGTEYVAVGDTISVQWMAEEEEEVRLELSRDDGVTWTALVDTTANDGEWSWVASGPTTSVARIRVLGLSTPLTSTSESPFLIYEAIDWLEVAPGGGSVVAGEELSLSLDFDCGQHNPGQLDGVLYFAHNGEPSLLTVPVVLTVTETVTPLVPERQGTRLWGNSPNPFNPSTKIRFRLANQGWVRLEIFDTAGRRVHQILDGVLQAGEHEIFWDSQDARGRRVASGTYLYTLQTPGAKLSGKMTLVK